MLLDHDAITDLFNGANGAEATWNDDASLHPRRFTRTNVEAHAFSVQSWGHAAPLRRRIAQSKLGQVFVIEAVERSACHTSHRGDDGEVSAWRSPGGAHILGTVAGGCSGFGVHGCEQGCVTGASKAGGLTSTRFVGDAVVARRP